MGGGEVWILGMGEGGEEGTLTVTSALTQVTNLSASCFRSCSPVAFEIGAWMLLHADDGWQAWP